MHNKWTNRIIAITAVGGALLLFAGTSLHPMHADPNEALSAFTEYAADQHWVTSHLMQLFGVMLMISAILLLSRRFAAGPAQAVATVGVAGAVASLAVAAALQAVDGIALKSMADTWAAAPEPEKGKLFPAVFAVRQIEIGLASLTSLLFGMTVTLFGIALSMDRRFPNWLGILAIAGGVPTAIAGTVIAYTGFSGLAMAINMPANILLLLWMISLGIHVGRSTAH